MSYRYALAGNPNCGKTTLFNTVTGSNQYVGNWPGVTVEKKEGKIIHDKLNNYVVDLPGIYSLSPYSMEEIVTRNYIIDSKPDLIINIVDATNLERNLYLSLQLAELGIPMVIALNMMDILEKNGDTVDCAMLENLIGIKIVPISASKGTGIHKLLHAAEHEALHAENNNHFDKHSGPEKNPEIYTGKVKEAIKNIEEIIRLNCENHSIPIRWSAVKLIEGDNPTKESLHLTELQIESVEAIVKDIEEDSLDREMIIADQKYKFICSITEKAVKRVRKAGHLTTSDKIDRIVTNKYLAIPFFFALILLIFYFAFGAVGSNLSTFVNELINVRFSGFIENALISVGASDWAVGLVCDGIIGGVGAVLSFFPQIFILFFFLSILEDSGYMSRAAFIMDRALHAIGLSGKSFVPMLMGFGCSVPAIMATRTLEHEKDRRLTIMLIPFMSCSAKMPAYSMFILIFFEKWRGPVIGSIYLLGIIVAIICAFILQKTVLKGGHAPFVMELPPYRMPTAKTLGLHLFDKVKDFITKAGTVLLGASIVIWFCQYFSFSLTHVEDSSQSILGIIGTAISPVFSLLGFGDWKSSVALLSGLVARESIVSTMGILFGDLSVISSAFTPAAAYSFMVFSLLFIPCIAAVASIRREMNSRKWTAFALVFQGVVAWVVTFIVYNIVKVIL